MSYQGKALINPGGNCGGTVQAHQAISLPGRPVALCLSEDLRPRGLLLLLVMECPSSHGQRRLLSPRRAPSPIKEKEKSQRIYFEAAVQLGEFIILD